MDDDLTLVSGIFEQIPPLRNPVTVYRGVEQEPNDLDTNFGSLIFTTFQQDWAYNFIDRASGNLLLEIVIPAGTKVIPWSDIVSNYIECEVLLDGTAVKVVPGSSTVFIRTPSGDVNKMTCTVEPL